MRLSSGARITFLACAAAAFLVPAGTAVAKKGETVEVCKHGCDYRTIQKAVNKTGKNATINVHPGTYREGVTVEGSKHDGLTIQGTKKNAKKVILDGKNARVDGQPAQNGIEGDGVDNMRILNLWVRNYVGNGVFVHGVMSPLPNPGPCRGYLMKNLRASYNKSYGLFARNCIGGRITKSIGYGHGDSAFYIGETPAQTNPKWTKLDHLEAHTNVLGYSGTNSKYVKITKSDYYNNGVGIVPNTLDSEEYEPNANGIIEKNNVFWNNFNYFLAASPVQTISDGLGQLGDLTIQFPTGGGIILLGSDSWVVRDNAIFGNFKWGAAVISDPTNEGDDAISRNNEFSNNAMGRDGADTNGFDFFSQGSGSDNCFSGNVTSTFDPSDTMSNDLLYPSCPAPAGAGGNGTSTGDDTQFAELLSYVTTDPPEKQQCSWTIHDHPSFKKFKPLTIEGATCP